MNEMLEKMLAEQSTVEPKMFWLCDSRTIDAEEFKEAWRHDAAYLTYRGMLPLPIPQPHIFSNGDMD